jgi:hypothetical protein
MYKYFVYLEELYNKFNEYLIKNNIKYSFEFKDLIYDLYRDEMQKYFCKLTGCIKSSTTKNKREYTTFAGIIFKDII